MNDFSYESNSSSLFSMYTLCVNKIAVELLQFIGFLLMVAQSHSKKLIDLLQFMTV